MNDLALTDKNTDHIGVDNDSYNEPTNRPNSFS